MLEVDDKVTFKPVLAIALAIVALGIGAGVYLFARNAGMLYLCRGSSIPLLCLARAGSPHHLSGLVATLPTALHVLAFSVMTAPLLRSRYAIGVACLLWVCVDSGFEFLQIAKSCPFGLSALDNPLANLTCAYIVNGSFDWMDIASAWFGAGIAYVALYQIRVPIREG